MSTSEVKKLSFELNEEMLGIIAQEFDPKDLAAKFAAAVAEKGLESATKEVLEVFGNQLGHRSLQLGDEYSDRTYEMILETVDQTTTYKFPLLPQRFLEIAYLSTQGLYAFPVRINSHKLMRFEISDCKIFEGLKNQCSEEDIKGVPCRAACESLIKTVCSHYDCDVNVEADTDPVGENKCVFAVHNG
ncbi:hypothetical protein ACFL9T_03500 [Thermodesulfobacteriota bacterium]